MNKYTKLEMVIGGLALWHVNLDTSKFDLSRFLA